MKKLIYFTVLPVILLSCNFGGGTGETNNEQGFKIENREYKVELTYDSTTFLANPVYNDFLNCEVYFSDDEKNIWKLHVYTALGSMHGYKLYDKDGCKQYTGARFYVKLNPLIINEDSGTVIQVNRIEELKLLEPEKYLKRNLITLVPEMILKK
ncbi:MAG: hypothetical protein HC831_11175 [Chloroflexia bacterium]|nr:hypothetical protein [Chloroflexia bacterium]